MQTSYIKKFQRGEHASAVTYLRSRVDDVFFNGKFKCNSFSRVIKKSTKLNKYERMIEGISFHPGICFIFKRFDK